MKRLSLEWTILDQDHVALAFDTNAWKAFQTVAEDRGLDASEMIAEALPKLPRTAMRVHPTEN